jgi:MoxR-like ATPase
MVIATQVESGSEGTYSITDVQMDRFILRALSKYPSKEEEKQVISNIDSIDKPDVNVITTLDEIRELQMLAKRVEVSPDIAEYIVSFIELLRQDNDILSGPSSRCSIALYKCSRVLALLDGRDFVIPDDVKRLIFSATEHRIKIKPEAEMDDVTPKTVLERILEQVAVPKLEI